MPLRVLLAEDNALLRQGLVRMLMDHPEVAEVRECASLEEVRAEVTAYGPDVVLTDLKMPPAHRDEGVVIGRELRLSNPGTGVVVLSNYLEAEHALALLADGSTGRGYLLKDRVGDVEQLVAALAAVCRGESVIDPQVVDELMRHQARSATNPVARLTSREREVLALVATGAANAAVAQHLVITQRAVEKHINAIFAKLELPIGVARDRRVSAVLLYLADSGARTLADPGRR
ncbi:MAG: response regulator transcription factor [Dermatophilaceae bacterium]